MGVGLAVAVLLDASIVRALLLPATMKLLGRYNWYLPRRLSWLPQVSSPAPPAPPPSPPPPAPPAPPAARPPKQPVPVGLRTEWLAAIGRTVPQSNPGIAPDEATGTWVPYTVGHVCPNPPFQDREGSVPGLRVLRRAVGRHAIPVNTLPSH